VKKGEFVAMMGPSGCGKSTLLNIIGLLDRPGQGRVTSTASRSSYRDKQVAQPAQQHLRLHLPELPPDPGPARDRQRRTAAAVPQHGSGAERRRLAREALERVGLGARMDHYPNQLSGGQQQRVAIARAIVGRPQVLLADEPTGNLDSKMGAEVMDILLKLNAEGTTIVMVTHDEREARRAGRIVRVFDGQLVAKEHAHAA
jgi:putative ABC transport system ATP-binding protein